MPKSVGAGPSTAFASTAGAGAVVSSAWTALAKNGITRDANAAIGKANCWNFFVDALTIALGVSLTSPGLDLNTLWTLKGVLDRGVKPRAEAKRAAIINYIDKCKLLLIYIHWFNNRRLW